MAKVKAGAQTARLITINHAGKKYDVVPNGKHSKFVEVPDEAVSQRFAQSLIESGDLIVSHEQKKQAPVADIETLRAKAEELGIDVDKRWKAERLQKEIDEHGN